MSDGSGAAAGFGAAIMIALTNGHAVRHAREGICVTRLELAAEVGIFENYLLDIEEGRVQMLEETALRVWAALSKFDQEHRRSQILVRLENDVAIVTEHQTL